MLGLDRWASTVVAISGPRSFAARSALNAAKFRVHIRIMRLEPIPERSSQQTRRRARRTALQDEVLTIKEICRIPGIERERLEPREGSEWCARPLPAVADKIGDAEPAVTFGIRTHWNGIPAFKIKV